jgi:hypothetical protein
MTFSRRVASGASFSLPIASAEFKVEGANLGATDPRGATAPLAAGLPSGPFLTATGALAGAAVLVILWVVDALIEAIVCSFLDSLSAASIQSDENRVSRLTNPMK